MAARESKGRTLLWRLILQFTGVMTDATGIGVGYRHCLARLNTGDANRELRRHIHDVGRNVVPPINDVGIGACASGRTQQQCHLAGPSLGGSRHVAVNAGGSRTCHQGASLFGHMYTRINGVAALTERAIRIIRVALQETAVAAVLMEIVAVEARDQLPIVTSVFGLDPRRVCRVV